MVIKQNLKIENLKQMAPTADGKKVFMLAQADNTTGLTQVEVITTANRMGAHIITNKEFEQRLVRSDTWESEKEVYPAWTDFIAYKKPNKKLGKKIKCHFVDDENKKIIHVVKIPKEFRKEKNVALVVHVEAGVIIPKERNFFDRLFGKILNREKIVFEINDKSKIALLQNFPSSNGWHIVDKEFGIPLGNRGAPPDLDVIENPELMRGYLLRRDEYCGLMIRGGSKFYFRLDNFRDRRNVDANNQWYDRLGVLVAAPEGILK